MPYVIHTSSRSTFHPLGCSRTHFAIPSTFLIGILIEILQESCKNFSGNLLLIRQETLTFVSRRNIIEFFKAAVNLLSRVILVVKFSRKGYKIRKVFGYKSIFQEGNYCILWADEAASYQKVQKSDFPSQFSMSKKNAKFSKKKFIEKYHFRCTFFCYWHFVTTSVFKTLYFLKWFLIFNDLLLDQLT